MIIMHELGTVKYIIDTVENICDENGLTTVASVTLEIGEVSGLLVNYMTDYWNWAVPKSRYLKTAELKIEYIDAVTYCENCGKTYPTVKYAKICPYCQSDNTYLLTGNEYNIKEMEAM